jgi:hypothetical protein
MLLKIETLEVVPAWQAGPDLPHWRVAACRFWKSSMTDGFVCSGFWFWFLFWFWQRRCHPKTNETKVGENRARSPEAGTSA